MDFTRRFAPAIGGTRPKELTRLVAALHGVAALLKAAFEGVDCGVRARGDALLVRRAILLDAGTVGLDGAGTAVLGIAAGRHAVVKGLPRGVGAKLHAGELTGLITAVRQEAIDECVVPQYSAQNGRTIVRLTRRPDLGGSMGTQRPAGRLESAFFNQAGERRSASLEAAVRRTATRRHAVVKDFRGVKSAHQPARMSRRGACRRCAWTAGPLTAPLSRPLVPRAGQQRRTSQQQRCRHHPSDPHHSAHLPRPIALRTPFFHCVSPYWRNHRRPSSISKVLSRRAFKNATCSARSCLELAGPDGPASRPLVAGHPVRPRISANRAKRFRRAPSAASHRAALQIITADTARGWCGPRWNAAFHRTNDTAGVIGRAEFRAASRGEHEAPVWKLFGKNL
jgi:hypothetical protein